MKQRVNIIATFELPHAASYPIFRAAVEKTIKQLEEELGDDSVLEYLALEKKTLDTIVRD